MANVTGFTMRRLLIGYVPNSFRTNFYCVDVENCVEA